MSLLDHLNEEQVAAVTHGDGPQLVLAGAGSGKTRVITHRVAWLIRERSVPPWCITAVTFTNKAASEMAERVERALDGEQLGSYVGTFHRFALLLLRRYGERINLGRGFSVIDDRDQISIVKQALKDEALPDTSFPPRTMLSKISDAKSRLEPPDALEARAEGFFEEKLARVYIRYNQLLRRSSALDFDDLLAGAVELLRADREVLEKTRARARYLLVDEFQDTNHAQLSLVRELAGEAGNLTAVGDEDQGIYRWRGADLDNILDFEKSFPGAVVRKLERNYRSTQNILDASGAVVAHNERRRGKRLWTDTGAGSDVEIFQGRDEVDEARWVVCRTKELAESGTSLRDIGFLVRTNGQTRALEEELLRTETPYTLVGGTRFYSRAEIKDLIAYLRLLHDPHDDVSLQRVLNQPPRGIGKATESLLAEECARRGLRLWDFLVLDQLESLPSRSARAVRALRDLMDRLRAESEDKEVAEVLELVIEETGFLGLFSRDDADSEARLENVRELVSAAHGFVTTQRGDPATLEDFLDHVALVSDIDELKAERGGVSVMTLHSAKGLEFPVIFLLGLEEGLLPHYNSLENPEEIEEERRLLYVGMTRAMKKLTLTTCRRRRVAGRYQDQRPSQFIREIPGHLLSVTRSPGLFANDRTDGVASFFGRSHYAERDEAGDDVSVGAKVRHPTLGDGDVLAMDGSGGDAKLTVFFERAGKRRLVAKYANLEVL